MGAHIRAVERDRVAALRKSVGEFAVSYADQTARDHRQLADAIASDAVEASIEE
jgi:hypothetical protein